MKKAIVTGANGFIGAALVRRLLAQEFEVIALAREGRTDNVPRNSRAFILPYKLSESFKIAQEKIIEDADIFFHLAWAGPAGLSRANTALQLQNAQWTVDCLRLAKETGCKRFVAAGSIMEHEAIAAAYHRGNRPGLGYIYGSGKLAAHTMSMSVAADISIDLVWAKITNTYGPGELSPRFVNTTIRKIINHEPLQFTSGTQNYDFVYIDDVAEAFYLIGVNGKPFCDYLIGSSNAKPLKEFILEMKQSIAPDQELIFGDLPFTGTNLPIELFDCSLTEAETGFKAKVSFSEGVRKTMDWLRDKEGF